LAGLARGFIGSMMRYQSASDVEQFNHLIRMMLSAPGEPDRKQAQMQLEKLPGGKEFLMGGRDQILFNFFLESSGRRHSQILAHETINVLSQAYRETRNASRWVSKSA
jgi:hypothetical protein